MKRNQSEISHDAKSNGRLAGNPPKEWILVHRQRWRFVFQFYRDFVHVGISMDSFADCSSRMTPWADTSTIAIFESPRDRFARSSTQASISIEKRIDYSVKSTGLYTRFVNVTSSRSMYHVRFGVTCKRQFSDEKIGLFEESGARLSVTLHVSLFAIVFVLKR